MDLTDLKKKILFSASAWIWSDIYKCIIDQNYFQSRVSDYVYLICQVVVNFVIGTHVHSFYQPLLGGAAFIQSKVQNSMFKELRKEKVKNEWQSKHDE